MLGQDGEIKESVMAILAPRLCLNRYYLAEGVRIHSQVSDQICETVIETCFIKWRRNSLLWNKPVTKFIPIFPNLVIL